MIDLDTTTPEDTGRMRDDDPTGFGVGVFVWAFVLTAAIVGLPALILSLLQG
jgi:hypothetical protein